MYRDVDITTIPFGYEAYVRKSDNEMYHIVSEFNVNTRYTTCEACVYNERLKYDLMTVYTQCDKGLIGMTVDAIDYLLDHDKKEIIRNA